MKNKQVLMQLIKAINISFGVTILVAGATIMLTFLYCFMTESSTSLFFQSVRFITTKEGDGYYTSLQFENVLFLWIFLLFCILSFLIFAIIALLEYKKRNKGNRS